MCRGALSALPTLHGVDRSLTRSQLLGAEPVFPKAANDADTTL